tara:strand:+ start:135 stop:416 length:282 start_codon:yes stop_codon:yes gene_type:complete
LGQHDYFINDFVGAFSEANTGSFFTIAVYPIFHRINCMLYHPSEGFKAWGTYAIILCKKIFNSSSLAITFNSGVLLSERKKINTFVELKLLQE